MIHDNVIEISYVYLYIIAISIGNHMDLFESNWE